MGNINVFIGPMKCGKSKRLIEEANKQKLTKTRVTIFKPQIDNREGMNFISSRDEEKLFAININNIEDLLKYEFNTDVFIIDEFQFLKGNIDPILYLVDKGKKFFIAGLNLTAERTPFGKMGDLLCIADNIVFIKAICEECHNDEAIYTHYIGGKDQEIVVGYDNYIPLCKDCYKKLNKSEVEK